MQWAVVATRLPSHTILGHEVEAMTGECPTVMERPHHLDVRIVQIAEQQLIVQVMIMNVMEADDIRLQLLDMPDERLCSPSPLAFSLSPFKFFLNTIHKNIQSEMPLKILTSIRSALFKIRRMLDV